MLFVVHECWVISYCLGPIIELVKKTLQILAETSTLQPHTLLAITKLAIGVFNHVLSQIVGALATSVVRWGLLGHVCLDAKLSELLAQRSVYFEALAATSGRASQIFWSLGRPIEDDNKAFIAFIAPQSVFTSHRGIPRSSSELQPAVVRLVHCSGTKSCGELN